MGPTTSTTLRTLKNTSPDDTNTIWLAKNGNDANPGTQASPVLTFQQAVSLLGGAKTTIQMFRNGYTGNLIWEEDFTGLPNSRIVLPDGTILQAELGETPKLIWKGLIRCSIKAYLNGKVYNLSL